MTEGSTDRFVFFERAYPSANMVLVRGERPVLVDPGYGADLPATEKLLRGARTPPENLALIVNSHYHRDHAGANSGLQRRYGVPVAAHRWEAELVNRRDREACGAEWLDQPVEPYEVNRVLSENDEIDAGGVTLRVLHTPGHTLGHVSLWAPEEGVLILGDAVHGDDVSWINPFREGVGGIVRALETLDRLSELPVRRAYSGHGPVIEDLAEALSAAQRRYERWLDEPERAYWHACKRILAYALMIYGGMPEGKLRAYLLRCPWFDDYARHGFGVEPENSCNRSLPRCSAPKLPPGATPASSPSVATTSRRRAGVRDPSDRRTGPRPEDLGKLRLDGDDAALKRHSRPEASGGREPWPYREYDRGRHSGAIKGRMSGAPAGTGGGAC